MDMLENIVVTIIAIGIAIFGFTQWMKTRRIQKAYRELSDEQRSELDKASIEFPLISAYAKPLSKTALISIGIGFGLLILMLVFKT